jgi:internalin A
MIRAGIFIGLDKTGNLKPLRDAADAAHRMYEWATAQGMTAGKHAMLFTDANGSKVRPHQIYDAIRSIIDEALVDQLFVYFAGYAVNLARSEHWLLTEAPINATAAVNVSGSVELARYCGINHVVIISDTCRVAPDAIQAQYVHGVEIFPNNGTGTRARPVDQFYASYLGGTAREIRDPFEAASHFSALYTSVLLQGLRGERPEILEPDDSATEEMMYVRPRKLATYLESEVRRRLTALGSHLSANQYPDALITSPADSWLARFDRRSLKIAPVEIVIQGDEATLNYFQERDAGEVGHLYEAKMLILGDGGSGKTSLLRRLYQRTLPLPTESETTKGIAVHRQHFAMRNGRRFRLNVWDFGGQHVYHATHQFFLTRRSLYILLDDTRNDNKSVADEGFRYWLDLIDVFGDQSPVIVFQNEKGGRSKAIDLPGIKARYANVKERYAGNLADVDAADELREAIEFHASHLPHVGEILPEYWIKIRADIEARSSSLPYISQGEYFDIYRRHAAFDQPKALHLSQYLHDLGVLLHYQRDPLLRRTVILQNEWATEAVFRILDDEDVKGRGGRFTESDCERLWRASAYAEMHPELLSLMQLFELCYLLPDIVPRTWLAPQLLAPTKPPDVDEWKSSSDLVLRYTYEFLPKGLISRLMVRLHRFVRRPELAWATGVQFERDDTAALVQLLPNGYEIELRTRGGEKKGLMSIIASDLDLLNESIGGLREKVDKRVPCICSTCRSAAIPEFFDLKALLKRRSHNRLTIECESSYENVDVRVLLDGVHLDVIPTWAEEKVTIEASRNPIRIFLASSSELKDDRDEFELYFRRRNDLLRRDGRYLEIVRWENFLDCMSETRLQDEYNANVRNCDIFVSLFFSKTGKYTEEEFDTAHRQFKLTGKPRIFTFFKNGTMRMGDIAEEDITSLLRFKKKLSSLGHFFTAYNDVEHLKRQFRDQLDLLFAAGHVN